MGEKRYLAKRYIEYKKSLKEQGCYCCGFNHPDALEVHHLATEFKKFGRAQSFTRNEIDLNEGKAVILCANCHSIFHSTHGGKIKPFPLYTKDETKMVIENHKESL